MENVDIKLITKDDLDDIFALSEESFPAEYNVTKVSLRQKLIDDADKFDEGSLIIREAASGKPIGFIGTKISHSNLYPDTGWISIVAVARDYRRNGYGRLLVSKALEALHSAGVKRVSVGQEFHNFFSGIPNPSDENLSFFNNLRFAVNEGSHYDLEAVITDNTYIESFDNSVFVGEFEVKTYNDDYNELMRFLDAEFPGRWAYEVDTAIKTNKNPSEIVLLFDKRDNKVVGFCMLTSYKDDEGKKTGYGGLGPIGIAEALRGRQVGNFLLRESLVQAKLNGITRVNIDWTILVKFYGQFGFRVKRTYIAAYKELQ